MAVPELTLDASSHRPIPVSKMVLRDLETVRLLLRGGSVVDWRRLNYRTRDEVEQFFRLHLFDLSSPSDHAWVRRVLAEAVDYLRTTFEYRIAAAVADPPEVHDLFQYASGTKEPGKYRRIACIVLKVMHVIHHIEGRELLYRTPISEADLFHLIDERVMARGDEMRRLGFPIVEFTGNVKGRHSIITKLLAKKETVAAQVFDKVRYRIVTAAIDDVLPVLHHLTCTLIPFNLVVPAQTENTLISFRRVVQNTPELRPMIAKLQMALGLEDQERRLRRRRGDLNRFSGSSYRMLSFVVDLPVRIDGYLPTGDRAVVSAANKTAFGLVEFQIVDAGTAAANEQGENSHERYKHRQRAVVLKRLSRGLVVPKGAPTAAGPPASKGRADPSND